jgi:hypothetical protein
MWRLPYAKGNFDLAYFLHIVSLWFYRKEASPMIKDLKPKRAKKETAATLLPKDFIALEKAREERERFFEVADEGVRPFYLDTEDLQEAQSHQFITDEWAQEPTEEESAGLL